MIIEVVSSNITDMGKYKKLVVAYRANGKLAEKTLLSFGGQVTAYETLVKAPSGATFEVTAVKNDKGFWDWTEIQPAQNAVKAATSGNSAPPRTFETPEERAERQKLIVRQSSLSNSLEFFKLNSKKTPTIDEIKEVAEVFVNFVFNKKDATPGMEGVMELEDDIPV